MLCSSLAGGREVDVSSGEPNAGPPAAAELACLARTTISLTSFLPFDPALASASMSSDAGPTTRRRRTSSVSRALNSVPFVLAHRCLEGRRGPERADLCLSCLLPSSGFALTGTLLDLRPLPPRLTRTQATHRHQTPRRTARRRALQAVSRVSLGEATDPSSRSDSGTSPSSDG